MREYDNKAKLACHADRVQEWLEGKNIVPVTFEVSVTNQCNFNCSGCSESRYRKRFPRAQIPVGMVCGMLRDMRRVGVRSVTWAGGGEPTSHPDFESIALAPEGVGIDQGLITNGSLLHRIDIEPIAQRFKYIRISLNASNAGMHSRFHEVSEALFPRVLSNIGLVSRVSSRGVLGVSYIVTPETAPGIAEAAYLVREAGADYIQFKPFLGGDNKVHYDVPSIDSQFDSARLFETKDFRVFLSRFREDEVGTPYGVRDFSFCYAHRFIGSVAATGEVLLCCNLKHKYPKDPFSFGSLHRARFHEIWSSAKRQRIVDVVESDPEFLRQTCMYCRMNDYNSVLAQSKREGLVTPLWRFI